MMNLKEKFADSCERLAMMIENNDLVPGARSVTDRCGGPNCSMGWIAVMSGLDPTDAYLLFQDYDIAFSRISNRNDYFRVYETGLVNELRLVSNELKQKKGKSYATSKKK